MTGLNQTADQYVERSKSLRDKKEKLQEEANKLLQEKVPLENDLKNLREKLDEAKLALERLEKFKA